MPPNVNLNLQNLGLPSINLGTLPPGLNPQQLTSLVQQAVQATAQQALQVAAQKAAEELLKALPQKGFEHITFNTGWHTEK